MGEKIELTINLSLFFINSFLKVKNLDGHKKVYDNHIFLLKKKTL